ncbi:MAG: chromate transporter [Corallococcus sp.]|nr:chromate transporter [Corallococcus sp.]MCM1359345.1 chromate transporter [Corallococcus sp.]MCM1394788.1 chromate transporter [Corallococcus sp.]
MNKKNAEQPNRVSLWQLFLTFLKVGAFTFGGGYAMIAILEEELVAKKKWITSQDMLDLLVIAESTPGVIAVNTATSVGFKTRGFLGALLATLGVVLPSFLIIFGLSFAIQAFQDNKWYKAAFTGIQACVAVLIINAFIKMSKQIHKDVFSFALLFASFGISTFVNFNSIYIILVGGALGVLYTLIYDAAKPKNKLPLQNVPQAENAEADTSQDSLSVTGDTAADVVQMRQDDDRIENTNATSSAFEDEAIKGGEGDE